MEYTKHLQSVCFYCYYYYILLLLLPIRLGLLWAIISKKIHKKCIKICIRKSSSCVCEIQQEVKYMQYIY